MKNLLNLFTRRKRKQEPTPTRKVLFEKIGNPEFDKKEFEKFINQDFSSALKMILTQ